MARAVTATIAFIVGFITAALLFRRNTPSVGEPPKPALPTVGTRWNLRGHDGEVFAVHGHGKRGLVVFAHDDGDSQAVPIDYFMAVAQPDTRSAS